jgi:hypothetical protein
MPNVNGSGHAQQPMYVSGRSKRKMPVREKGVKEPLHFNVAGVAKGGLNFLHPRSSKGKEVAHPWSNNMSLAYSRMYKVFRFMFGRGVFLFE